MAEDETGDDNVRYLVGKDGYPLNRPSDDAIKRADEARFHRGMQNAFVRWQGGDLTAFSEALRLVWRRSPETCPLELVKMSEELVERAMAEDEKRARREWRIHLTRWEALVELRERSDELKQRFGDECGTSWERAREAVSEVLETTEAVGTAAAIKASYELVEAAGGERATFESYLKERRRRSKPG
jgi:hypothetical protein